MPSSNRAQTTEEDVPPDRPLHITREIPLWGILTVLGAFAGQAVALYYSTQSLAKSFEQQNVQLTNVAADVKSINQELNQSNLRSVQTSFRLDDMTRRVTALELLATSRTSK